MERMRTALRVVMALAVVGALGPAGCDSADPSPSDPDAGVLVDDAAPNPCDGDVGCPCDSPAACDTGLVCDVRAEECREPLTCADVTCEVHRLCVEPADGDAHCGDCETGYRWDDILERCEVVPSCDPDMPGSIVPQCAADNRTCDDTAGDAECGACLAGSVEVGGRCVAEDCSTLECPAPQVCTEGDGDEVSCAGCETGFAWSDAAARCLRTCEVTACHSDERCVERADEDDDAACVPVTACDEGRVDNGAGVCVACVSCYTETAEGPVARDGVLGIANDGVAYAGRCVCDLAPGYFQSLTGDVLACDGDGDGWLNRRSTVLADTPFEDESGCVPNYIDRFVLRSDDLVADTDPTVPVSRDVTVQELVERFHLPTSTWEVRDGVHVMSLVEDEALDEDGKFKQRYEDPGDGFFLRAYGDSANRFDPSHANPLTKVCNHDSDDFNMDGLADVSQAQGSAVPGERPAGWTPMSFFVELADGYFEPGEGAFGRYVIRERARTTASDAPLPFPLPGATAREQYEAMCMRSRDAAFPGLPGDDVEAVPGFDFAQYQCDADSFGCSTAGDARPGAHVAYDGRLPEYADVLERYAREENGGVLVPWDTEPDRADGDALWPGMNHHSQFKCVTGDAAASPFRRTDGLNADGTWDRYECSLAAPSAPGEAPAWSCEPTDEVPVGNHWAVARFEPYGAGNYERGCIDEAAEWAFSCPEWTATWGAGEDFVTDELFSGRFTCQTECQRSGRFLITDAGAVCCYGDGADQCTYDNFGTDDGHVLLCALPGHAAAPEEISLCSEALGAFQWAPAEGGQFDPNVLKWAPVGGDSVQHTTWGD